LQKVHDLLDKWSNFEEFYDDKNLDW
jgi:hypothetical protein